MEIYVPITETEISYDKYHEFHVDVKRVINANKHITVDNFEYVEEPDVNDDDPNSKHSSSTPRRSKRCRSRVQG